MAATNTGLYVPASVRSVDITSPFYGSLVSLICDTTLPTVIASLKDTGRYYALSWTRQNAPKTAHCFWDSDAYKVMEAVCYYLMKQEDSKLRKDLDTYVEYVKAAQWEDGYINSYYTLHEPENRLTNLRDMHELYCLGHLAEFATAYHCLTGSHDLINVCRRYVELLHSTVIPNGGYDGHEELELALLRLYEVTNDDLYLNTCGYFVRERGKHDENGLTFYDHELSARGIDPNTDFRRRGNFRWPRDYAYMQAHCQLADQEEIDGHCVRAVYFLTGALHYGLLTKERSGDILRSVDRLFDDMVNKKMYLTGGIGSVARNEGFGPAYNLPDLQEGGGCYSETCASFGLIMLCERYLRSTLNARYGDIMETALLNCVLGALSTDGSTFYYENPLATEAGKPWHRSKWFDTACCPPNIVKVWGLLPSLQFSVRQDAIAIHLYFAATYNAIIDGQEVQVNIESGYPFDGDVKVSVQCVRPLKLALRIPGWAKQSYSSTIQGTESNGYLWLEVEESLSFDLNFSMKPAFVFAHPHTRKDQLAILQGPLVYCAESVDNDFELEATFIEQSASILERAKTSVAGVEGVPELEVDCSVKQGFAEHASTLYSTVPPCWEERKRLKLIPYFLRENRGGAGAMRVWFGRRY